MSAVEDVVTEHGVEAVPKRAMTLGYGTSLVVLILLLATPLFREELIIFQIDDASDLRPRGIGAEHPDRWQRPVFAWPECLLRGRRLHVGDPDGTCRHELRPDAADRGVICFAFGFLFGQPALRLSGVYLALATLPWRRRCRSFSNLDISSIGTGGVQGLVVTKPTRRSDCRCRRTCGSNYFTLAVTLAIYIFSVNS